MSNAEKRYAVETTQECGIGTIETDYLSECVAEVVHSIWQVSQVTISDVEGFQLLEFVDAERKFREQVM